MPKRKRMFFSTKDIAGARVIRPVDVGRGQNMFCPNGFFSGKIYLKPKNFGPGKRIAQRVFLKEGYKENIERELLIRQKLKAAGLPVPKAGLAIIGGKCFMAIEPFLKKGGGETKLVPINTEGNLMGEPFFLEKITMEKNKRLIEDIAKDTAKMYNSGVCATNFDFFGFYRKKNGNLERIIMDTGQLENARSEVGAEFFLGRNLDDIFLVMKDKEALKLFMKTVEQNLQSKELKKTARKWLSWAEKKK